MKNTNIIQPVGIIKTMPIQWLGKERTFTEWENSLLNMNYRQDYYWTFNLPGKPKYEVIYFYLNYNGAIRFRMNIIGYEGAKTIKCFSGEHIFGKCWIQVGAPVIKLKEPVPMKGFQGFRYTKDIYE